MSAAPAPEHISPRTIELRALIDACLVDLARWVRLSGDLVDTHQAPSVPFLTPDARVARDDQVRAERDARHYNRLHGTEIPGESPAPVAVGAVSVVAETHAYLTDLCQRLVTKMRLAGICWVGERTGLPWLDEHTERPQLDQVITYTQQLLTYVRSPKRLERIHRDLEDLTARAKRVVEGEDRSSHVDPCPHCGRRSLVVFLNLGVIRCEEDPDTRRREPCTCADPYCPCNANRGYRHEWNRAEKAHKTTSWQGLRRDQRLIRQNEETEMTAQAAIERIRTLHRPTYTAHDGTERLNTVIVGWNDQPIDHECWHDDVAGCVDGEHHEVAGCGQCGDPEGGYQPWPCATICAIDEPPTEEPT